MYEGKHPAAAARESALARMSSVKRWVAGGAVALTGIFSAVAAHALPANHTKSVRAKAQATTSAPAVDDGSQQQVSPDIVPPDALPQPSAGGAGVVSGGS